MGTVIHEVGGNFVISSHDVWLPGSFDSRGTAHLAFRLNAQTLQRLQDEANARMPDGVGGTVSRADVNAALGRPRALNGSDRRRGGPTDRQDDEP